MPILPFFIGSPIRAIVTSCAAVALVPTAAYAAWKTVQYEWVKKDNSILRINLDEVRNLRAAEHQGYLTAQAEAKRIAEADKARIEASYTAKLERKNRELTNTRSAARIAADRYAAANRVRIPCPRVAADDIRAGRTDMPQAPDTTVIVDGQRCYTGMVAVSRPDFDTLVDNTVRLANAREWALSLQGDGL